MNEFYGLSHFHGLSHLLSDNVSDKLADFVYEAGVRSADSLLFDAIDVNVKRENLESVIEATKAALDLRAYMLGFSERPVFHFEHCGFVYVICNVEIDDFTELGEPFKRPNVCCLLGDYKLEQGKISMTGRLLPIRVPELIARLRIVE